MRMWNIPPYKMCNQHLLGEHVEMHMFIGALKAGKSIQGYIDKQQVEVHNIIKRHDELAVEMIARGMNHKSPLRYSSILWNAGKVDINHNIIDLSNRCPFCSILLQKIN